MGKKDEKLTELSYTVEAMQDEVNDLRWANKDLQQIVEKKQARIVELINENDRLTMTYEPYRPPGDEDENISYYDLKEENEELVGLVQTLREHCFLLERTLQVNSAPKPRKNYAGVLSFDFWPISDWFRFKIYRWNPGKAFQFCIGPIRLDFFEG